ncbi:MAG: solute:sodium symporter family transporter [Planctomycetaceae bacterium]|nr:solute:sodium symporter family transporter [Planctomycetaceae bacterium]
MVTVISFVLFTALVAVVAWWRTHNDDQHTSTGYFLAGRSLSWIVVGGSLLLTNLSTEQLVGLNGGAYQHGMIVMAWEVWSSLSIVAMAVFFLPRYLKSGITTIPEFLELRFSRSTRTLTSVISLVLIVVNVLPFVLLSGAEFMITVFGVPELTGTDNNMVNLLLVSSALALIGGAYAIFGGLKAVAVSDTVNGVGLVLGGFLIPVLGLGYIGNGSLTEGVSIIVQNYPQRLSSLGDRDSNIPWETLFTGVTLMTTYYWCTNQGIVQRTFASKNLAEGQKGTLFAAFMKLLGPLYLVLPGIIAWHIARGGQDGLPKSSDDAYGYLVNLVLPGWAVGFFAATIFGAILSSFNSFLNSATTMFGVDIYQPILRPGATEPQTVRAGKIFGLIVIPVSVGLVLYFKLYAQQGLFDLMKATAAILNVPMIAIVFVAFVSKRTPAAGANVALIAGMVFQFVFGIWLKNSFFGYEMHWLHLAALNFVFLLVIMAVYRLRSPLPVPYEQTYTEQVDITPWRLAKPIGLTIVILIAAMYLQLWKSFGITPGQALAAEYQELHKPE